MPHTGTIVFPGIGAGFGPNMMQFSQVHCSVIFGGGDVDGGVVGNIGVGVDDADGCADDVGVSMPSKVDSDTADEGCVLLPSFNEV